MTSNGLKQALAAARAEVAKVIIGQSQVVDRCLIAIFTGSHALVEGVPGVAKTLLVRTLAQVLGCSFARIQFTPDLMPADITGTNVFNLQRNGFTLIKGPVFTSFLLADEINRAPAKTQSALLQAMQERMVTIDRETHILPANFTVFATQNPIEFEGTYPLPEAQKDRFMLKITMKAPERAEELTLAQRTMTKEAPEALLANGAVQAVIKTQDLQELREQLGAIVLREELTGYLVDIVRATRQHESVLVGAGLAGLNVALPEAVRMSKDRTAKLELRLRNERKKPRTVRLALALPPEIQSPQEDARVALPDGSEWSRLDWPCLPLKRGNYRLE